MKKDKPFIFNNLINIWLLFFLFLFFSNPTSASSFKSLLYRSIIQSYQSPIQDKNQKGHVLYFLFPDCPLSEIYTLDINALQKEYPSLHFQYILPGKNYTKNEVLYFEIKYKLPKKIEHDYDLFLCHAFDIHTVPTVVFTNPQQQILYYGKIDDRAISLSKRKKEAHHYYIRDAIASYFSNLHIKIPYTVPVGCIL